jgi:hypothetical protein
MTAEIGRGSSVRLPNLIILLGVSRLDQETELASKGQTDLPMELTKCHVALWFKRFSKGGGVTVKPGNPDMRVVHGARFWRRVGGCSK